MSRTNVSQCDLKPQRGVPRYGLETTSVQSSLSCVYGSRSQTLAHNVSPTPTPQRTALKLYRVVFPELCPITIYPGYLTIGRPGRGRERLPWRTALSIPTQCGIEKRGTASFTNITYRAVSDVSRHVTAFFGFGRVGDVIYGRAHLDVLAQLHLGRQACRDQPGKRSEWSRTGTMLGCGPRTYCLCPC